MARESRSIGARRRAIRILFLGLVPLLVLQFAYAELRAEPYPAIRFPSFGKSPRQAGRLETIDWKLWVLFRDGSSAEIARNDFLAEARNSHREFIMALNFSSERSVDAERSRQLRDWTLARCRELTGRQDVSALRVERVAILRRDSRAAEILSREVQDTFVMELE